MTTHNTSPLTIRELAAVGLDCMEHWYGLPESLCDALPMDYLSRGSTQTEAEYFRGNGTRWKTAYEGGRDSWPAVADELVASGLTLVPTLSVYAACADLDAARSAPWQAEYTHPNLAAFFAPDPHHHGSFWESWTRADEETWTDNLALWGRFLLLYHDRGGRVAVGTDEGFMYSVFGFGFVRHLQMLVQAGFSPLDAVRAATLSGAEALGAADRLGSIEEGKLADLVVVRGDPLRDFGILNDGVVATVKDGIVFGAPALLADVRAMVAAVAIQRLGATMG